RWLLFRYRVEESGIGKIFSSFALIASPYLLSPTCFTFASHARMSGSCSSWKWPKMRAPVSRSPSSQGKRWGSLSCSSRKREDVGAQLLEDLARIVEDGS